MYPLTVRSVFALPVLLLASLTADAFGYRTHAQVCDAAYDSLPAAVQQHIDGLVGLSGKRTFGELCGWPDDVRKEDDFRHTGRWHYINVPRDSTRVSTAHCHRDGCVLSALDSMSARLTASPDKDWQALAFFGHLVADIHQPLHVSYEDDRGGNDTRVRYDGDPTNLHALWDNQIPPRRPLAVHSAAEYAGATQPLEWAQESLDKTRQIYAHYRRGQSFTQADIQEEQQWMQQRLQLAATRLALALTAIFED